MRHSVYIYIYLFIYISYVNVHNRYVQKLRHIQDSTRIKPWIETVLQYTWSSTQDVKCCSFFYCVHYTTIQHWGLCWRPLSASLLNRYDSTAWFEICGSPHGYLSVWSVYHFHRSLAHWPCLPLPSIRQHLSYDDCLEDKRENYHNCSVLYCVTLGTIICTLIWTAVVVVVLGFGFMCFCVFTWAIVHLSCGFYVMCIFCLLLFGCQYQCNQLPGKTRLWNNVLCVEWDVKPYTLIHWPCPVWKQFSIE